MKIRSSFLCFLNLLFGISLFAAEPPATDIVLRGILDAGDSQVFSLGESNGKSSAWVQIGQAYKDYTLTSFDPDSKTLQLSRGDSIYTLTLEGKKTGELEESQGDAESRLAAADALISQMNFSEMIEKTMDVQIDSTEKMMNQQLQAMNMDTESIEKHVEKTVQIMAQFFKEIDWAPVEEGFKKAYAETFTQPELDSISDFYATPAGSATIEKQPELQRRLNDVLFPVIMEANQKVMSAMHEQ